jgi:hypothetical protein
LCRGALFLYFLLAMQQMTIAQESVEQILAHTEEVYRSASTYKFSGVISYDWKSQKNKSRMFQESFQCFRGDGVKAP